MAHGSDPVELGYVASLAKPGSNITGLTHMAPELGGKRLELLKSIVPKLSRVAILTDPGTGGHGPQVRELEPAGPALNLQLRAFEVRDPASLESAFYSMGTWGAGALIGLQQPTLDRIRVRIVELAAKTRLPAIYPNSEYVEVGGLLSYAADIIAMFHRTATYVDRILKGTKPADLPVEQPTKFELVINLKTAKQIGLDDSAKCAGAGGQSHKIIFDCRFSIGSEENEKKVLAAMARFFYRQSEIQNLC